MKKISFLMAALLVAMTGCQKEPQAGNDKGLSSDDKVYMSFSIQTMNTRSATDTEEDDDYASSDADPSIEVGLDKENTISTVDVVLRTADAFIHASQVTAAQDAEATDHPTWIAEFPSSQLVNGTVYDVYIYANCSAKQDLDATSNAGIDQMTAENKFWMTNAYTARQTAAINLAAATKENPFDLGTHYVERSMARFDYMPVNNNVYEVATGTTVTLTEAALINQSKEFYLLRRVSDNGTATGANFAIGGVELPANYVVDTDYTEKADGWKAGLENNFDYHMTAPEGWDWQSIAPADLTQTDNWNGTTDGKHDGDYNHELNEYYVWQYVKENTIPGTTIQENGISTGVVFKGEIASTDPTIAAAMTAGETIYVFEGVLYGSWNDIKALVDAGTASEALTFAYNAVEAIDGPTAANYAQYGFKGFSPVDGKYYTYYYYWNRHNDNGNNEDMGVMEFAVVRNNVYKLCVDEITAWGHPTPGGNDPDPDPVDPSDPDESSEYYFKVTVKVLPWIVRVNHIGF